MSLKRQLTLVDGISLALGSIMGSGLLFLPSLTAAISGTNTTLVWVAATMLCFPLLYFFNDMVSCIKHESGIEGFVSLGLGENIGAVIPILFLGTVCIGMPISALIVGEYVKNFLAGSELVKIFTALCIVYIGIVINLVGIKIGSFLQLCIALSTFLIGALLFFIIAPNMALPVLSPVSIGNTFHGIVAAFWAYAGFENLTFIVGEFKNPARDFKLSMLIALILCGLLYLLLSLCCIYTLSQGKINEMAGLYQLADALNNHFLATLIITLFAYFAVQINFNSWIWGISRLIYSSANQGKLPIWLSTLNKNHIPVRAILLLLILFTISLLTLSQFQGHFKVIVALVSTNFIFIYILCLVSYLRFKKTVFSRLAAMSLLLLLISLMLSSGLAVLYPLILFLSGIMFFKFMQRK